MYELAVAKAVLLARRRAAPGLWLLWALWASWACARAQTPRPPGTVFVRETDRRVEVAVGSLVRLSPEAAAARWMMQIDCLSGRLWPVGRDAYVARCPGLAKGGLNHSEIGLASSAPLVDPRARPLLGVRVSGSVDLLVNVIGEPPSSRECGYDWDPPPAHRGPLFEANNLLKQTVLRVGEVLPVHDQLGVGELDSDAVVIERDVGGVAGRTALHAVKPGRASLSAAWRMPPGIGISMPISRALIVVRPADEPLPEWANPPPEPSPAPPRPPAAPAANRALSVLHDAARVSDAVVAVGCAGALDSAGFLVSADLVLTTARRLCAAAAAQRVRILDGLGDRPATVAQRDDRTDLALLKLPAPTLLKPPRLGRASRALTGQTVVIQGPPVDLAAERTTVDMQQGVVTRVGRRFGGRVWIEAAVEPLARLSGAMVTGEGGRAVGIVSGLRDRVSGAALILPIQYAFLDAHLVAAPEGDDAEWGEILAAAADGQGQLAAEPAP